MDRTRQILVIAKSVNRKSIDRAKLAKHLIDFVLMSVKLLNLALIELLMLMYRLHLNASWFCRRSQQDIRKF